MTGLVVKELVGWFNYSLIVIGRERIGLTVRWIAELKKGAKGLARFLPALRSRQSRAVSANPHTLHCPMRFGGCLLCFKATAQVAGTSMCVSSCWCEYSRFPHCSSPRFRFRVLQFQFPCRETWSSSILGTSICLFKRPPTEHARLRFPGLVRRVLILLVEVYLPRIFEVSSIAFLVLVQATAVLAWFGTLRMP